MDRDHLIQLLAALLFVIFPLGIMGANTLFPHDAELRQLAYAYVSVGVFLVCVRYLRYWLGQPWRS